MDLVYIQMFFWAAIYILLGVILSIILNKDDKTQVTLTSVVAYPILTALMIFFAVILLTVTLLTTAIDKIMRKKGD